MASMIDNSLLQNLPHVHVAAWNERDRSTRDSLLRTIYAEDIKMYDPNLVLQSLTEVSDFIGKLHIQDPEFLFSAAGPIEFSQNGARLYGHIGTRQNPRQMNSMDFLIIENGKAAHLYVFIDPGAA
jgi:hypothetical protein